jgi:tetratricopeptide (TPR) repeat protein
MQELNLTRLDESAMAELSAAMLGPIGQQSQMIELLSRETEGNTFFLVEAVRALAEEAGSLGRIATMTLPRRIIAGGVQAVIRRRLDQAPGWAQPALTDWEAWLTACVNAAVLEVREEQIRFSHDKLREVLLIDLTEAERPALHHQIASALETVYPNDEAYIEILAEHWSAAGDIARALPYIVKVAYRLAEITAHYDRASRWIAQGLTQAAGTQRAELLWLQGRVAEYRGDFNLAAGHYEACLAVDGVSLAQRAAALYGLCSTSYRQGNLEEAKQRGLLAVQAGRAAGDPRTLARTLNALGVAYHFTGDYTQARAAYEQ